MGLKAALRLASSASLAATAFAIASPAAAQAVAPGGGAISRDSLAPPQQAIPAPVQLETDGLPPRSPGEAVVKISNFTFIRDSNLPPAPVERIMQPFVGRELTLRQMTAATHLIVAYYRRLGLLVSVLIPPQEILGGVVTARIVEGRLGNVTVDGRGSASNTRFVGNVVKSRVKSGAAVNFNDIDHGLLVANDLPGVRASAVLEPGARSGEVALRVHVDHAPEFGLSIEGRNWGPSATGVEQLVAGVQFQPNVGYGIRLAGEGVLSHGTKAATGDFSFNPLASGLQLGIEGRYLDYRLQGSFKPLDLSGDTKAVSLLASYPVVRTDSGGLRIALNQTFFRETDRALGVVIRDRTSAYAILSLNGEHRDAILGGGVLFGSAGVEFGRANLGRVPADLAQDLAGPHVDGHFTKFLFSIGRSQAIVSRTSFAVFASAQFATRNLDSSEQFVLGGPSALRGYPVGYATGSEGYFVTSELRYELTHGAQLFLLADGGHIRANRNEYVGSPTPNEYNLYSLGAGIRWSTQNGFRFEGIAAAPIGAQPLQVGSAFNQAQGRVGARIFFRVTKLFGNKM